MAILSNDKERSKRLMDEIQGHFSQWVFIGFNLHRNTGKAHQSLSGSKVKTIDNIQRTLRAYSESGSDS